MFEGFVRQLLLGYLGRYIKDIQRDQLKITLWNEEVLLENVELILEAFDYLQLPFALKEGRVGRLSIKIPWKKLGWDPIIITLEDVFICACQRDDQEWSTDAVERRELAWKKAKLATAELAKLSRRVCDIHAGQSFSSYITAKILEGIQVSIRNVHVVYCDLMADPAHTVFGLRFSSLTITKQDPFGIKFKGGLVNKLVDIQGLQIYYRTFHGTLDSISAEIAGLSKFPDDARVEGDTYVYIVAPFDVSFSLLLKRSGKLENDAPQYSVGVELTGLIISLDEVQLQQILTLWDYLCTCRLREKYGRYRPWSNPLSRKHNGWQTIWWHYAQQSVLSDVRKRLKKTSWKYLGERLNFRRKYVNLYKTKLECLQQEQLVDDDILRELEEMEKESDMEDILNYRSAAEHELQDFLVNSASNFGRVATNTVEKSQNDERLSSAPRGWLNWLSLGMLGAGGTDDSSQFSGVVSDEVIKDIYEATKFHPMLAPNEDTSADDEIYLSAVKFSVHQISATLRSMKYGRAIAELIVKGIFIECKLWEESAVVTALVNAVKIINPVNEQVNLLTGRVFFEKDEVEPYPKKDEVESEHPSLSIQVDVSQVKGEVQLSPKVILQLIEVTCDSELLLNIMEFYNLVESFKFQHERVLLSLSAIEDVKTRLLSKAEFILSSGKRLNWDFKFNKIIVSIPWEDAKAGLHEVIMECGALSFASITEVDCFSWDSEDQSNVLKNFTSSFSTTHNWMGVQLQDFYDHFEIKVNDFEMKIKMHQFPRTVSVLEKFCASMTLASCIIPDETILNQLEVYLLVSSLHAHFSPSIHKAVLGFIANLDVLYSKSNIMIGPSIVQHNDLHRGSRTPKVFCFSVIATVNSLSFRVNLENDNENGCILMLVLQQLDIGYALREIQDCWISVKAMRISINSTRDSHILCSSGNQLAASQHDCTSSGSENSGDLSTSTDGCFLVHYEARRKLDLISHECTVYVNDIDLHCYPRVIGLLTEFIDNISRVGAYAVDNWSSRSVDGNIHKAVPGFGFPRFGFSNFFETGLSECTSIPLDRFPFLTIYDVGYIGCLESVLIHPIPEWRKTYSLRERKALSPRFSVKKVSKVLCAPPLKYRFGRDTLPMSQSVGEIDFLIHLNVTGLRVYFHDSSCILGTITLPACKSSFSVMEDCFDILCSTEGLLLSSSWWTENISDFLWGPSLSNLPPIVNVRVKKGYGGQFRSDFEISFSIHHVCCFLPPDFLAAIIGYFSLPDWTSTTTECPVFENPRHVDSRISSLITYKIEILDSILFTPVEGDGRKFLKLEMPQLYCSFFQNSDPNSVLNDISPECLVPTDKVADENHCLNLFGRDLCLSLLLKDGPFDLVVSQETVEGNLILIQQLSADIWVRIPCESEASCVSTTLCTCIMARVTDFQLIAEDGYIFAAFEALLNIINQFSSVHEESKGFTSDLLNFRQIKRCIKENIALQPETSTATFTQIRCCVSSLAINLYRSRKDSFPLERVAKAGMQLIFSASFRNEIPQCMDISFSSLELFSFHNSVILAQCLSSCSFSSVLDLHLSSSNHGVNELDVTLPSLDIWLYLFDWIKVIELFDSYSREWAKTLNVSATLEVSTFHPVDQNGSVNIDVLHKVNQAAVSLSVKSEHIGVTVHIPVCVSEEAFSAIWELRVPEEGRPFNGSFNKIEGECDGFIAVTLRSRCTELVINGKTANLESTMEKIDGTVGICKRNCVHSWPFFQLFQVKVESDISYNKPEPLDVKAEVQCYSLDVWLSHHVFYFWQHIWFQFPEAESSESPSCFFNFEIQLQKGSLLFTDARWGSSGPLLEILLRNLLLRAYMIENKMEGSVTGDLQVNYNNIHKVLWEPFIEPWKFQLSISRIHEKSALLNGAIVTDIHLLSTAELNLNVTESLIEAVFRAIEMIKDAWDLMELNRAESQKFLDSHISGSMVTRRYAPYILQNLTSLPLVFHVCRGPITGDYCEALPLGEEHFVLPGSSIPIYVDETPTEQLFCYRPSHSYDKLSDKQLDGVAHHYAIIQFDGTSVPSDPISMDLVGVSYFEVDLTKPSNKMEVDDIEDASKSYNTAEENGNNGSGGFLVPVVFDVSVQRYSKLVRLYSTVILNNASSVPFEVRFDIPFGVSPKVLDPVYPGQELPLPLHLAEAGRMRCRPIGNTYLWSEAHNISNILSQANRIGFLRSFVCYPCHPSSDPFRCCISIQDVCLPSTSRSQKDLALRLKNNVKHSVEGSDLTPHNMDKSKKRFLHQVTLSSPLVVKNYLPEQVSLTIESGGVSRTALLSEVETSFFHIDSSHDLGLAFHMHGFKPAILKFPRAETFSSTSKFSGTKFSLSETITFDPDLINGPMYITVEKVMDAFSGAREIFISAPILLYNCTGFSLIVSNSAKETKGHCCIIPSCYNLGEEILSVGRKDGLGLLSSNQDLHITPPQKRSSGNSSSKSTLVSSRKLLDSPSGKLFGNPLILGCSSNEHSDKHDLDASKASLKSLKNRSSSSIQSNLECAEIEEISCKKAKGCIYSPIPNSSDGDITVRVSGCMSECDMEDMPELSWSSPFALVPPTGSTSVLVPQPSKNAAYIISVTSSVVAGPFSGRTRIITFQPRYIISNASSKDLWCKQKGTDFVFQLGVGQHYHLHWTDTTRELLVSIRFIEPGWQWSGSFLPEHLGDTQVKMRNYISGVVNMIRVEVQNADVSFQDENVVESSHANSGTTLILLSDDDTGYMPYRIDNFSKERLRVYQQKCETSETIVHSYTSCPYAWDEPCYPHRLTVEVPGEHIIGSYPLDYVKEYPPAYLPSTSEKPERTLLVSVHAEGAMKVISIIDSGYHVLTGAKEASVPWYKGKKLHGEKHETFVDFREKISVAIPFIGISVMNSYPQEIIFASAKNTVIEVCQSVDQQKFSFQVSSLQIDNQLLSTAYPVLLSFDHEYRGHPVGQKRTKDDNSNIKSESLMQISVEEPPEPVFCLAASTWRNKEVSLVSFECINLRVSDFHLELEQEVILSLFDFFRKVSSRFQGEVSPCMDFTFHPLIADMSFVEESFTRDKSHVNLNGDQFQSNVSVLSQNRKSSHLAPSVVPIGAPWQRIHLLARRQKKIYVEVLDIAPIKLTLSFSSSPWILKNGVLTSGESLIHKGLMALADIEGAQIYLKKLTITHQMASLESIQQILMRHYTRQILHEMYKVFGSAGVIGNPMGFARSVGLGIRDFLSVPARSFLQSPAGLITGMAQGTTSLLSNTVYAVSDAATQFSRAAHKGIVAFTFDAHAVAKMDKQQKGISSHSKGVVDEIFEGLTGLLQSPIKGAEKHGLPGVLSGVALGITGLVARPAASILEVTGKTAQSIRNRSKLLRYHHQMGPHRFRIRLPRPLSRVLPLRPYSWEEAVGTSVLREADDDGGGLRLKDEVLVMCKELKQGGRFVIITERFVLIVSCSSLVDLGKPEFRGVPPDPLWVIEEEIGTESVIHADTAEGVVHIVGSSSDKMLRQTKQQLKTSVGPRRGYRWNNSPTPLPLFQTNLEFKSELEAEELLQVLLSTTEKGKERGWGSVYILHQTNLRYVGGSPKALQISP